MDGGMIETKRKKLKRPHPPESSSSSSSSSGSESDDQMMDDGQQHNSWKPEYTLGPVTLIGQRGLGIRYYCLLITVQVSPLYLL